VDNCVISHNATVVQPIGTIVLGNSDIVFNSTAISGATTSFRKQQNLWQFVGWYCADRWPSLYRPWSGVTESAGVPAHKFKDGVKDERRWDGRCHFSMFG
jgi:hypothetical protein